MPLQLAEVAVDKKRLESALKRNLALYNATYLALAQTRGVAVAITPHSTFIAAFTFPSYGLLFDNPLFIGV